MDPVDALTIAVTSVIVITFVALSIRIVPPGERLVVYRLGKTSAILIRGCAGRKARYLVFTIPLVDRVVRVRGDLVKGWDALRDTLPADWFIRRPVKAADRAVWPMRAEGSGDDEITGTGSTQQAALVEVTRQVAERSSIIAGR